jgi:GDP-L-fucose synthase
MRNYSDSLHINVGSGEEVAILELTRLVMEVLGHDG